MKLAVVSDLHLDAVTHGVDRFDDGVAALNQAVDEAIALAFDVFVFCGDLCDPDSHRAHRAVAALISACYRLRRENIEVWTIPGNHDVIEDGTGGHVLMPLRESGWAGVFDQPFRDGGGKSQSVLFLPFVASCRNYDPAEVVRKHATEDRILVFGHLNLPRAMGGSESSTMARGRDVFWPLDAIREHMPNALCIGGHYHKHQQLDLVTIVGSPTRLRFDEEHNFPGWLKIDTQLLDVGKGVEFVPTTNPRALQTIAADHSVWSDQTIALSGFKGSIVRLQVPAGIADGKVAEVKQLYEQFGAARAFVGSKEREGRESRLAQREPETVRKPVSARQAVLERLERTASIEDKVAVRGLLDGALDSEGV